MRFTNNSPNFISPTVIFCLIRQSFPPYGKFELARLCQAFADLVTYVSQVGTLNRVTVNYMTSAIRRALKVTLVPRQHICACLKLPQ